MGWCDVVGGWNVCDVGVLVVISLEGVELLGYFFVLLFTLVLLLNFQCCLVV